MLFFGYSRLLRPHSYHNDSRHTENNLSTTTALVPLVLCSLGFYQYIILILDTRAIRART